MVDGSLISGLWDFSMDSIEHNGFRASPLWDSVWCSPAFFFREKSFVGTNMFFTILIIFDQHGPYLLWNNSRNHYQNLHPDPDRILVGTLNPWNGRPRVVPWPILLERVVSKPQNSRPYLLVCNQSPNHWSSKGQLPKFATVNARQSNSTPL